MVASGHTSHYDLSQFAESDRPTWFGDYNTDMAKIDTAIYEAANIKGTAVNPYVHDSDTINLDDIVEDGFHAFNNTITVENAPFQSDFQRSLMLVSNLGYNSTLGIHVQLWINRGVRSGAFFIAGRVYAENRWSPWNYLAARSEVQAIGNRVAALEAKLAAISSPTRGLTAKQYDESYANDSNIIIAGQE